MEKEKEKQTSEVDVIPAFRRVLPQVKWNFFQFIVILLKNLVKLQILATFAKNLIIFNLGEFGAFPSLVIPSLIGVCSELNPDENVHISASQTSWLCETFFNQQKSCTEEKRNLKNKNKFKF